MIKLSKEDFKQFVRNNPKLIKYIKNIDLDAVQESINSIQRVLGVVGDMASKNNTDNVSSPRPLYQHLDD